jgi:hypothetical protein
MRRRYWIGLGVLAVAVVAAGSALAAAKLESPSARGQAIIRDAAGRLNVTPGALSSALEKALDDQVDVAVAAGRLTKEQGDALKGRIDSGQVPLLGGLGVRRDDRGFGFGFGRRFGFQHRAFGMFMAGLNAVTAYLGITRSQLRSDLAAGKSLAQIAKDQGKTADGLVAALVAAVKQKLDQAVGAKRLGAGQEQSILSRLQTLFQNLVNRTPPAGLEDRMRHGFGFGLRRHAGTPPADGPPGLPPPLWAT